MTKRMLVDATHPEETRVAIVEGNWLNDFDFERASKKELKGNIYLAKVIRIEPSLQAAFVEYGGNRHGFLPFSEIHPDYFRIPMADRPHDELDEDEEEGDEISADEAALYQSQDDAVAAELAHHDSEHQHTFEPSELAAAPEAGQEATEGAPMDASEFAQDPAQDLGLITDFGNAAAPMDLAAPIPVETVGGEIVEEEQRPRRQARPRYKIQEVVKRRQIMLIQVVKEERGNKGAALTTFLSLAGRYCVLMPNTDNGGGVSRKITSHQDRRRMKEILDQLEIPEGMAVILRTAGMEQEPAEIQRDLEYLLRLWNNIREETLQSTAPSLIYEEANLIKRSMRDLYSSDVGEILVSGERGYQLAGDFMRTIMPDQMDKVKLYTDAVPLFFRYNVEKQIDQLYNPVVQLRSGGYIVINPTEALVSIDVNSGRATRERHIESTALKTNLEAADEIARQLRLRDLAGLVVIDFIDMEDGRNNAAVERRMKEAMRADRARLQIGRISPFGLMELSRQRLHPSLMEINFEKCSHCSGMGLVRSVDSAAITILRVIEEDGIKNGSGELMLHVPSTVALYVLNQKREALSAIERRYGLTVFLHGDDTLVAPDFKLERTRGNGERGNRGPAVNAEQIMADTERDMPTPPASPDQERGSDETAASEQEQGNGGRGRRFGFGGRGRGRGRGRHNDNNNQQQQAEANGNVVDNAAEPDDNVGNVETQAEDGEGQQQDPQRRGRRRGRRGGRGRRNNGYGQERGPRQENGNNGQAAQSDQGNRQPAPSASYPTNIHEIDTTPREYVQPVAASVASSVTASPSASSAPAAPPPYEIVNTPPDKPRGGWWRKLTGQ
ncbi:MAG: ribonuclease E/G [Alphaproteobacteria bacterium]|nr:ribonuclease E/G [Alphaproteobacteria bacterium]MBV8549502.1 ribonuclease E/G [Alphaproteobacteria bacterium]